MNPPSPRFKHLHEFIGELQPKHPVIRILESPNERSLRFLNGVESTVLKLQAECSAGRILDNGAIVRLKARFRNSGEFFSATTETEWAVLLSAHGTVTLEPMYPRRGPDLRCALPEGTVYVEISGVGREAEGQLTQRIFDYIQDRMKKVSTRYVLCFEVGGEFLPDSKALRRAVARTKKTIQQLEHDLPDNANLYYSEDHSTIEYGDSSGVDSTTSYGKKSSSRQRPCLESRFKVRFTKTSKRRAPTILVGPPMGGIDKTWLRIRSLLHDKLRQLVPGERNVVVVDCSETFAGYDDFLNALYGHEYVVFSKEPSVELIGHGRRRNGFFVNTTRLHAVVRYARLTPDASGAPRIVFPTSNPDVVPSPLSGSTLTRFGTVHPACIALAKRP